MLRSRLHSHPPSPPHTCSLAGATASRDLPASPPAPRDEYATSRVPFCCDATATAASFDDHDDVEHAYQKDHTPDEPFRPPPPCDGVWLVSSAASAFNVSASAVSAQLAGRDSEEDCRFASNPDSPVPGNAADITWGLAG